ncbi:rhomboid domain-containing protein 3-like [Carcharodon carcharias]|uniref:rhomboid domain-containing protein 3-like n=1 Tax=Carcharodon carcharias TaxID=13397 RepID=UPI001B7F1953|nr:rhomboid domain-containing protein 3-like [Carcharodon carcharias]
MRGCRERLWAGIRAAHSRARAPCATAAFLSLILLSWLIGAEEAFSLTADPLFPHHQVYRLLSYCFVHGNIFALLVNIALLVVFSSRLEQQLGSVRYLYFSVLFAVFSALLYLLLGKLLSLDETPVCGFTTVQFAMVTLSCCNSEMKRTIIIAAVPWILLPVAYLVIPGSSVLLHICGIIVGLTYSCRFLFCLELSNSVIESVERLAICRFLQLNSWIPFIFSPTKYHLPVSNLERFHPVSEVYETHEFSMAHVTAVPDDFTTRESNSYNIKMDSQWTETPNQTMPISQPHTGSARTNYLQADLYHPYGFTYPRQLDPNSHLSEFYHMNPDEIYSAVACGLLTDEDLFHAGVVASLQESAMNQNSKVEIPKSSVSSLRLQQLKQMGFSTEKAVLALAASGKVESAVNLLVEDQVGEDAVVTANMKMISK